MTREEIHALCMAMHGAQETYPFGPVPVCYKLGGRIFAQLYPYAEDDKITLKCTEETGRTYRMVYPDHVRRGYHCPPVQQPYFITITLDGFPDDELQYLIGCAYDAVLHGLSRKAQRALLAQAGDGNA